MVHQRRRGLRHGQHHRNGRLDLASARTGCDSVSGLDDYPLMSQAATGFVDNWKPGISATVTSLQNLGHTVRDIATVIEADDQHRSHYFKCGNIPK